MDVNFEIISRETIKPSSPTPPNLRIFNLSLLDQLSPAAYGSLVLFYSATSSLCQAERFRRLKRSLSETLTQFYPLAGRLADDGSSIECNDRGVDFVDAKVNCSLAEFLQKPYAHVVGKFIPVEVDISPESIIGGLVHVQATVFNCGGLAIGVCISYKIGDAITLTTFIKNWAAATVTTVDGAIVVPTSPLFNAAAIFPSQNITFPKPVTTSKLNKEMLETRRLVFSSSKIAALQAKSASQTVKDPSRVEVVTAMIWKSAMNASRWNLEHSSLSILSQSANIRKRTVPPLPDKTIGHLVGYFASEATEGEIELKTLVRQLRKGKEQFNNSYVDKLQRNQALMAISESVKEAANLLQGGNVDFYISISLCGFRFYGVNFGWGRPSWVTIPSTCYRNVFAMMDSGGGDGIEVWVTLTEDDMAYFERDPDLLASASLSPSVWNPIAHVSSL
ncbi:hypothetical protein K2173_005766 [Erythroxylum novogranatense]|uniref:BAHD acyltransferase n=1 Tax=Erythroxylum novogranatense TaxID=1862640 RepID=A0AAV8U6E7_9ROSI|nr:hypothetical protein K2173_005766 [Erythroxylum novogranatense]